MPARLSQAIGGEEQVGSSTGYCAVTGGEERGCDPARESGIFEGTFARVVDCLQPCVRCAVCHYVSYSKQMNDCSWYRSCNMARLGSTNSVLHRTFPVRHENGSITSPVAARLGLHVALVATSLLQRGSETAPKASLGGPMARGLSSPPSRARPSQKTYEERRREKKRKTK